MWAPHPRGRVIRRPQPDFSHRRSRIKRRPAPSELLDSIPDPRCNYKYFGIHRSDITDHLKHTVPSHAFHPSLVGDPPPVPSGRSPRHKAQEKRRPETAPAPTVWFGRTCSDVSDWLRYRPPAHLGLDPDNKPLPYYPSTSSLVTDPKWQTREFPALPNVLWHWWKERPRSVPLATNPQQVKFETLVDAVKDRIVRPRGPYTPPTSATHTSAPTPRNGAETPHDNTPGNHQAETPQKSRAQTPQLQREHHQCDSRPPLLKDFSSRPASASSSILTPRPNSALSSNLASRPASAPHGMPTPMMPPTSTPRSKLGGSMDGSPRPPPSPAQHHSARESPNSLKPLGSCGCENSLETPRSGAGNATALRTSAIKAPGKSPQVEVQKCACHRTTTSSTQVQVPSLNLQPKTNGGTLCTTPTPNKPPSPTTITSGKPPPSPQQASLHSPPHVPRQAIPRKPCGRHHAAVPSGLYVQGQGHVSSSTGGVEKRTLKAEIARASQGFTVDHMKQMSPNSFATKIVWAEKLKKQGQGVPWPLEEKKLMKAVKAY